MPIKKVLFILVFISLSSFLISQEYQSVTLKDISRPNKETLVLFSYSTKEEMRYDPLEYMAYHLLKYDFKITSFFMRSLPTNGFDVFEFNFN